jgi:hypothetical protein
MEESRLAVSPNDTEACFHRLVAILDGTSAYFVFNVDEMGHQEWADRAEKTCYGPSEHSGDETPFSVPRSGKRIALVSCIGPDGSFLKPLVAIHRKTIDTDIALTGLAHENVAIYSQPKGFIDRSIFWAWFEEVSIPEICQTCTCCQYAGNIILLMYNSIAHSFPSFESLYAQHGITICLLPPHSSNQTQPLDLSTFGNTKRLLARANRMERMNIQSLHIAHGMSTFMSAASPLNLVTTFRNAGINLTIADEKSICRITSRNARYLMASVDFEGNPRDETVSGGEATETQI